METTVAPPSSIETKPKVVSESRDQGELPGRTEVTREASREDALAATQCFFHTAPERRSATEVPSTTTMSVLQNKYTSNNILCLLKQNFLNLHL